MKTLSILFLFVLLAAGCSSNSPDDVATPFEPGAWAGTFTLNANYGPDGSITQSGVITFDFSPAKYTYEANVTALTNRTRFTAFGPGTFLRDRGSLSKGDGTAFLIDFATTRYSDVRLRSLYLEGAYVYSGFGTSMTISKRVNGETMTISLTKQD